MILRERFRIYTKPGCDFCDKLKDYLGDRGFYWDEYVLGEDITPDQFINVFGSGTTFPQVCQPNGERIGGDSEKLLPTWWRTNLSKSRAEISKGFEAMIPKQVEGIDLEELFKEDDDDYTFQHELKFKLFGKEYYLGLTVRDLDKTD